MEGTMELVNLGADKHVIFAIRMFNSSQGHREREGRHGAVVNDLTSYRSLLPCIPWGSTADSCSPVSLVSGIGTFGSREQCHRSHPSHPTFIPTFGTTHSLPGHTFSPAVIPALAIIAGRPVALLAPCCLISFTAQTPSPQRSSQFRLEATLQDE